MNTKTLAMLLIGVILGSVVGYFGNVMLTQPVLTDLQDRLFELEEDYGSLETDFNQLTEDNKELEAQLETLQEAYSVLQAEKQMIDEEQQALMEQLDQLEAMYESLLEEYETNLGGLDFSNQTIAVLERSYTWIYDDVEYQINITIPDSLYEYYVTKDRYDTSDYRGYILQPNDDEYIDVLIWEFDKLAVLNNMTNMEEIELVISFVQNLHYLTDNALGYDEYPKFPLETLVDAGGDCEDTSILLSSLLEAMDVETALLTLPGHMAIGVELNATGAHWDVGNSTYYYLETTVASWEIGSIPSDHVGKTVTINEVNEIPFLTHTWEAKRKNEDVTATITYTNESPVNGKGYRAWTGIELEEGELYSEKIGSELDLAYGESKTVMLTVSGPRFDTIRLVVGVLTPDGEVITKKYSMYFTTS